MRFCKERAWPAGPHRESVCAKEILRMHPQFCFEAGAARPNSKFERRLQLSPMPQMNDWFRAQRGNAV